jgi:hypothetical protein
MGLITSVLGQGRKELESSGEPQKPNRVVASYFVGCCKAEPQMKKTFRDGKIHIIHTAHYTWPIEATT